MILTRGESDLSPYLFPNSADVVFAVPSESWNTLIGSGLRNMPALNRLMENASKTQGNIFTKLMPKYLVADSTFFKNIN